MKFTSLVVFCAAVSIVDAAGNLRRELNNGKGKGRGIGNSGITKCFEFKTVDACADQNQGGNPCKWCPANNGNSKCHETVAGEDPCEDDGSRRELNNGKGKGDGIGNSGITKCFQFKAEEMCAGQNQGGNPCKWCPGKNSKCHEDKGDGLTCN